MGYGLMFYAIDAAALEEALSSPGEPLVRDLLPGYRAYPADPDDGDFEASLRSALDEIARGLHPTVITPDHVTWLEDDAAIALVVAARARGTFLGALEHASSSGEDFRTDFLDGVAAPLLGDPAIGRTLTERPFYGLSHGGYPSWGWATHAVIARWLAHAKPAPASLSPDHRTWLGDLLALLKAASDRGLDLFTLYH